MENFQEPNQEQNFLNFQQTPLPNATAVLVLGIISIVGCFCYGIVGLITSIIALILAKKDMALYNANPSLYIPSSYNNLKAGRVCAIVGIILSALYLLFVIAIIIIAGAAALSDPSHFLKHGQF
ncbi:CCC motif membrane protein [Pinibacter aurantiacus]|uniref:DUF4190 domain-containing protein n=1 Tax=Pinibacter aurantiacus TaxID=2851599 RepID=A0A9E2S7S7_9BACT|nr:CCC motif membrane protein [Pinibacter aurantiacus]MBV4356533.1 DUF4190 domain-containing protein [Pinibacter aurantiacus]